MRHGRNGDVVRWAYAFGIISFGIRARQVRVGCATLPNIQGWAGGIARARGVASVMMRTAARTHALETGRTCAAA